MPKLGPFLMAFMKQCISGYAKVSGLSRACKSGPLLPNVNRGSTFVLRRSTLDFCLGGQRPVRSAMSAHQPAVSQDSQPPTTTVSSQPVWGGVACRMRRGWCRVVGRLVLKMLRRVSASKGTPASAGSAAPGVWGLGFRVWCLRLGVVV